MGVRAPAQKAGDPGGGGSLGNLRQEHPEGAQGKVPSINEAGFGGAGGNTTYVVLSKSMW